MDWKREYDILKKRLLVVKMKLRNILISFVNTNKSSLRLNAICEQNKVERQLKPKGSFVRRQFGGLQQGIVVIKERIQEIRVGCMTFGVPKAALSKTEVILTFWVGQGRNERL